MLDTIITCVKDIILKISGTYVDRKKSITKNRFQRIKNIQKAEKEFEIAYQKFEQADELGNDLQKYIEAYSLFLNKITNLKSYFPDDATKARIVALNLSGEYAIYYPKKWDSPSNRKMTQEKVIKDNGEIINSLKEKDLISNNSRASWINELLTQYSQIVEQLGDISIDKNHSTGGTHSPDIERRAILDVINKYFFEIKTIIDIYLEIEIQNNHFGQ